MPIGRAALSPPCSVFNPVCPSHLECQHLGCAGIYRICLRWWIAIDRNNFRRLSLSD